jgi:hypothetical protein
MAVIDPARLQLLGHFDHLFLQVKRERQLVQFAGSNMRGARADTGQEQRAKLCTININMQPK